MSSARTKKGASARAGAGAGAASARAGKKEKKTKAKKGAAALDASGSTHGEYNQLGLLEVVQQRFLKDVFDNAKAGHSGWKILIVDDPSMKVISATVGMYDIMERQISLVESLDKKRAPFKDMAAIYILSPTIESVEKLVADYQDKSKLLYGDSAFVYFLGPVPKQLLEMVTQCKQLVKRLKALSEINVDFLVKEDRAFKLDVDAEFSQYYAGKAGKEAETAIAEKLVTLCASLNEYPYIRYNQSSGPCTSLATKFKKKMDKFVSKNPNWWYHGSGKSGKQSTELERSTILLLDRASDCLTPLMHDFTYQAMVQDLLEIDGDKITVNVESADNPDDYDAKDVLLNDKDKLWVELRSKHIAEVIEILSTRISETVNSGSGNALGGSGKDVSLTELASALKALPEYREVMAKLSQHMHISRECMDKFSAEGLIDLSEIEQTLATGVDEDGDKVDTDDLVGMVEQSLLRMNDSQSRLRLVLIAIVGLGKKLSDRDRLLRAAKLDRDQMLALDSVEKLSAGGGTPMERKKKKKGGGGLFSKFKGGTDDEEEESEYASSRYVPILKDILDDLVANTLSLDDFPSVVPMPPSATVASGSKSARSARSAKPSARAKGASKWGKGDAKAGAEAIAFTGSRNLVFMLGGLAYSEMKVARKVMEKESREIIIGSTDFMNPEDFTNALQTLN
ncbi:unnamed protein product [Cylindrotheca closterium]|uniref:Syntaxin-binding protein 1 n=1 Tax=Cylindrotheca closterium TaxID=2856 RepID=A0AAD2JNH7_9STRA|nr:unnamed protein product [Cylindrotheca closterium]